MALSKKNPTVHDVSKNVSSHFCLSLCQFSGYSMYLPEDFKIAIVSVKFYHQIFGQSLISVHSLQTLASYELETCWNIINFKILQNMVEITHILGVTSLYERLWSWHELTEFNFFYFLKTFFSILYTFVSVIKYQQISWYSSISKLRSSMTTFIRWYNFISALNTMDCEGVWHPVRILSWTLIILSRERQHVVFNMRN